MSIAQRRANRPKFLNSLDVATSQQPVSSKSQRITTFASTCTIPPSHIGKSMWSDYVPSSDNVVCATVDGDGMGSPVCATDGDWQDSNTHQDESLNVLERHNAMVFRSTYEPVLVRQNATVFEYNWQDSENDQDDEFGMGSRQLTTVFDDELGMVREPTFRGFEHDQEDFGMVREPTFRGYAYDPNWQSEGTLWQRNNAVDDVSIV